MHTHRSAVVVLSLLLVPSYASAQGPESALLPYTQCKLSGGLAPSSVERAGGRMARPVETAAGQERVSVDDGFRVMLAFPDTDPFVNLKIERSVTGMYAADKQNVLAQMQHMASLAAPNLLGLERRTIDNVEVAALNNPGLYGGATSFYSFFVDSKELIGSAYILDALPARRAFKTFEEYLPLRDRFVNEFAACLNAGQ